MCSDLGTKLFVKYSLLLSMSLLDAVDDHFATRSTRSGTLGTEWELIAALCGLLWSSLQAFRGRIVASRDE